jgi:hypothetical protein
MPYEELFAALDPLLGRTAVTTAQVLDAVLVAYNQTTGEGLTAARFDEEAAARLRLYLVEAEISATGPTLFHRPRMLDGTSRHSGGAVDVASPVNGYVRKSRSPLENSTGPRRSIRLPRTIAGCG